MFLAIVEARNELAKRKLEDAPSDDEDEREDPPSFPSYPWMWSPASSQVDHFSLAPYLGNLASLVTPHRNLSDPHLSSPGFKWGLQLMQALLLCFHALRWPILSEEEPQRHNTWAELVIGSELAAGLRVAPTAKQASLLGPYDSQGLSLRDRAHSFMYMVRSL